MKLRPMVRGLADTIDARCSVNNPAIVRMGRFKEYMIEQANLEQELVELCEQVLASQGYTDIRSEPHPGPGFERGAPDLIARDPTGQKVTVEVKLYRSPGVEHAVLRNAISQLDGWASANGALRAILVVSAPLETPPPQPPTKARIEIWDLRKLSTLVEHEESLAEYLADFVRRAEIDTSGTRPTPEGVGHGTEGQGAELALALNDCPIGREGADQFEDLCEQALKLLFAEQFRKWTRQKPVEAGFHRLDVLAHLVPKHEFWISLAQDFRTRYVVFEFKNYEGQVGQDQIYTTEKYLFTNALRSIAIIVGRNGENESARRAAKGALREVGKLILTISLEELIAMLRGWDAGEDPNNVLIEKLDDLLTDLGR